MTCSEPPPPPSPSLPHTSQFPLPLDLAITTLGRAFASVRYLSSGVSTWSSRMRALSIVSLCVTLVAVHGFSSGAPQEACGDMVPQHHTDPQSTPSPYTVSVDRTKIKAGENVKITIRPKAGDFLKGFFVQARVGNTPVGQFLEAKEVAVISCGNGKSNAATHRNSKDKPVVEITWKSPSKLGEKVTFRVTTVKNGGTFWVGQTSDPVSVE